MPGKYGNLVAAKKSGGDEKKETKKDDEDSEDVAAEGLAMKCGIHDIDAFKKLLKHLGIACK